VQILLGFLKVLSNKILIVKKCFENAVIFNFYGKEAALDNKLVLR